MKSMIYYDAPVEGTTVGRDELVKSRESVSLCLNVHDSTSVILNINTTTIEINI